MNKRRHRLCAPIVRTARANGEEACEATWRQRFARMGAHGHIILLHSLTVRPRLGSRTRFLRGLSVLRTAMFTSHPMARLEKADASGLSFVRHIESRPSPRIVNADMTLAQIER